MLTDQPEPQIDGRAPTTDSPVTLRDLEAIYSEFRPIAARLLGREHWGAWLQPSSLVHNTLMRMMGGDWRARAWKNRKLFFEEFNRKMRYVLLDSARMRARRPRWVGGGAIPFDDVVRMCRDRPEQLIEIADLFEAMAQADDLEEPERRAQVADHLIFGGRTPREVAELLGVSESTVRRDWALGIKPWLAMKLGLDEQAQGAADGNDG